MRDKTLRPHISVDDAVRVGNEKVEHLGEVAARTPRAAAELWVVLLRKEIASIEEAADHGLTARWRQLVHGPREEHDHLTVCVDVRGRAERVRVHRVDRIE